VTIFTSISPVSNTFSGITRLLFMSNIVYFNNVTEEPFLITIYSQLGQFVFQKMLNGSSIELPNLMHGVYVLKFENLISGDVQYARMVKGE